MRYLIKATVLILCFAAMVTGGSTEIGIDYNQIAQDMDVMSRIIDKTLSSKFPIDRSSVYLFRDANNCQSVYLKDYGAVFMTNVNFPVANLVEPEEKIKTDDLWKQTESEIKEGKVYPQSMGAYDSEIVEQLKDELIKVIGNYAGNIRQLGARENITIVIRGPLTQQSVEIGTITPQIVKHISELQTALQAVPLPAPTAPLAPPVLPTPTSPATEAYKIPDGEKGMTEADKKITRTEAYNQAIKEYEKALEENQKKLMEYQNKIETSRKSTGFTYIPSLSGNAGRTTLIIKISRENIMEYKNGNYDPPYLKKRAEIVQY